MLKKTPGLAKVALHAGVQEHEVRGKHILAAHAAGAISTEECIDFMDSLIDGDGDGDDDDDNVPD